jgi:hypothetical protein
MLEGAGCNHSRSACSVLGALEWWEAAQHDAGHDAAGFPWWTLPRASTAPGPDAAAWRAARLQGLAFRRAQVALTPAILLPRGPSKAGMPHLSVAEAHAQLQALAAAAGVTGVGLSEWHSMHDWGLAHVYLRRDSVPVAPPATVADPAPAHVMSQLLTFFLLATYALGVDLYTVAVAGEGEGAGAHGTGSNAQAAPQPDVHVASEHAGQMAVMLADIAATACVVAQGELGCDPAAVDGDDAGAGATFVSGITLHTLQLLAEHALPMLLAVCVVYAAALRHGAPVGGAAQADSGAVDAAVAALAQLAAAIRRVCEDLAHSILDCRVLRREAGMAGLGVSQRARRLLATIAGEQQVSDALQSLGAHHQSVLSGAADRLARWAATAAAVCSSLGGK